MRIIKKKKKYGQHFLKSELLAEEIVDSFSCTAKENVIEIGPGDGILTRFLEKKNYFLTLIEIDDELISELKKKYENGKTKVLHADFLDFDIKKYFSEVSIIGNFPYYISSQIMFKIFEHNQIIYSMVGMFQAEVGRRICSKHNTKEYGILSVLIQAFYDTKLLFKVPPEEFSPQPKVQSVVIKIEKKSTPPTISKEKLFTFTKSAFNQRRKMLRNSTRGLQFKTPLPDEILNKRPEQLSVQDFCTLSNTLL